MSQDFNVTSMNFKSTEVRLILSAVSDNLSQKQIREKLNLKESTLSMRLKKLCERGLAVKIPHTSPAFYELTNQGKIELNRLQVQRLSDGVAERKNLRAHNIRIYIPLLKDTSTGFWEKTQQMTNWVKSHRKLQELGVSVEKNTQCIVVNFKPMNLKPEDVDSVIHNGIFAIVGYLAQQGIELDTWGMRISRQEYAVAAPLAQPLTDKGITIRQSLGHPVAKIFDADKPKEAWAWIDASEGHPEIDTNDLQYGKNLLAMPEKIARLEGQMMPLLEEYHKEVRLHLDVMQNLLHVTQKLDKQLSQRSIREFLR